MLISFPLLVTPDDAIFKSELCVSSGRRLELGQVCLPVYLLGNLLTIPDLCR